MDKKLTQQQQPLTVLPCLVCGVDSGPVLQFFLIFVGCGLLLSIGALIWGIKKGKFETQDKTAQLPLQIEEGAKNG